jgi:hypothetical protein
MHVVVNKKDRRHIANQEIFPFFATGMPIRFVWVAALGTRKRSRRPSGRRKTSGVRRANRSLMPEQRDKNDDWNRYTEHVKKN